MSDAAAARRGRMARRSAVSMKKGGAAGGGARRSSSMARRMPLGRRTLAVAAILLGLFIGLPLVQALLGELGALITGCLVAGFALGRATA